MTDLFGGETQKPRGKHYIEPMGYAGMPGTGPVGKTCRDCAHYTHRSGVAGSYPKCGANRARWTGGRRSDILAGKAACNKFEDGAVVGPYRDTKEDGDGSG